jgi:hypothetical protein
MRWYVLLVISAVALAGCAGEHVSGGVTSAATARATVRPSTVPTVLCSRSILSVASGRAGGYRVVLRVVSVPPAFRPQVARHRRYPHWPYFSKAGLVVHGGSPTVTVTLPNRWRTRAAIEWGNTGPVSALRVLWCGTNPEKPWNAYAGGFYLRSPSACVPVTFRVAGRSATVWFGLGQQCHGIARGNLHAESMILLDLVGDRRLSISREQGSNRRLWRLDAVGESVLELLRAM